MSPASIQGTTRLYVIVGDPIAQVRSPQTFGARFAAEGYDAVLVPAHVPDAAFDSVMPALMKLANLDGVIATVPFKGRAAALADRVGDAARAVGAVNVLRREDDGSWSGDMFDGMGFVRGAEAKGARLRGRRAVMFGAGGAGSAIAHALATAGAAEITLVDPMPGRTQALADRLQPLCPQCRFTSAQRAPADVDMVVNASPIGMRAGDGLPGELPTLGADAIVGDVVIADQPTPLIRRATEARLTWVDGRAMLAGQADAIMAFLAPVLGARAQRPATDTPSLTDGPRSR